MIFSEEVGGVAGGGEADPDVVLEGGWVGDLGGGFAGVTGSGKVEIEAD